MNPPSFKPTCPNHGEPLEGLPFPLPMKGTGICPISGVPFSYCVKLDEDQIQNDKDGTPQLTRSWKVEGNEERK